MHDCLLDDTAPANSLTLFFFPITSTMKYKPNFESEWLAHLILIWNHQFQMSGCKVAVSTDYFVVLNSLSSKILSLSKTRPRLFPSTSSPIQHSEIVVLFNTIVHS